MAYGHGNTNPYGDPNQSVENEEPKFDSNIKKFGLKFALDEQDPSAGKLIEQKQIDYSQGKLDATRENPVDTRAINNQHVDLPSQMPDQFKDVVKSIDFDPMNKQSVAQFQQKINMLGGQLKVDGVYGPQTARANVNMHKELDKGMKIRKNGY
tara:strand:- start:597 stop:1055 length:459 start_codon:yes stop_codon:yes gene_type:complete